MADDKQKQQPMADDKQKQKGTGSNIQIIVAVISIVGTLGAAMLANWHNISKPNTPTATPTSPTPSTPSSASPTPATPLPEERTLNADAKYSTRFQNPENTSVQVRFKADPNDRWIAIPANKNLPDVPQHAKGYLSAKGALNFKPNKTPCPVPMGALIVIRENYECIAFGEEGSFTLEPRETVSFLMNDVYNLYGDNEGFINIKLSISKN